jgi:hypothetical protein
MKARIDLEYAGKQFPTGALFDALERDALGMMNRGEADRFGLEDPSQRTLGDIIENLLPSVSPVTISPTSGTASWVGGSGTFDVTITGPGQSGTWTVTQDPGTVDWVTVMSPLTPQSTDGTVRYEVAPNVSGAARSANMYVNGQTFVLDQMVSQRA